MGTPLTFRTSWATAAAFALLTIVAGMAFPSVAQAADDIHEVATSTYTVDPQTGRIQVTISLAVTNYAPDLVSYALCTREEFHPVLGWFKALDYCPRTINHYLDTTYVLVDAEARNLEMTADRGAVERMVLTREMEPVGYRLTFSPIYRNQTRRLTISYEIVDEAPRSKTLAQTYVAFCATSHGASTELDSETVEIVLPTGFDFYVWPAATSQMTVDGSLVLSTEIGGDEAAFFYQCLIGTDGELGSWSMPSRVLGTWGFIGAQRMIRNLRTALAEVRAADQLVPELDAENGPVRAAVEFASTAGDLVRAAELASEQRRAAEAVVMARKALGSPRDPIEKLGLIGTDLDALGDQILEAAARADSDTAWSGLISLGKILADARQQGVTRLAVVGVLVLGGWVVRRWRRRAVTGPPTRDRGGEVGRPGA